ncbi:helix-turn-helix domain-containing protein [Arachidicoccus sp.]|uniref:helix-turn-helix domain-containing protein n=1 Tax=Arachidicoccus sp. TaxID=1872624 RepID=UPI003D194FDF
MKDLFDIQSDFGDYFGFENRVHKSYKGLILPGSELYSLHGDFGNMVFQGIFRPLYHIWFSNYETRQRRHTLSRAAYGSVELSMLIRSNIAYNLWQPSGRVLHKQSQFNLIHSTHMENKALFEKDSFYTTLDYHAQPLLLDMLYQQYPEIMYDFLNEIEAGRNVLFYPKHLYATLPMLQLARTITALLAEPILDTFLLDTSVILLFGFAIRCSLEMSSKRFRYDQKKEMDEKLNAALAALLSDLKKFRGIAYYARMVGMSATSFKKLFQLILNEGPYGVWNKNRMNEVFQDVVHTNLTFDDIAINHGFAGGDSLTKAFKKYHKVPPSYYRK